MDQFPGRIITAELPKLPRPEVGRILVDDAFGKQTVFHPALEKPKEKMLITEIIHRIQRHVLERRLRIKNFFKVLFLLAFCSEAHYKNLHYIQIHLFIYLFNSFSAF